MLSKKISHSEKVIEFPEMKKKEKALGWKV